MSKKNKIAAFVKRDADETVKVQDQATQVAPDQETTDNTTEGESTETTNEQPEKIGFLKKAVTAIKGAVPEVVKIGKKAGKAAYTGLAIYGAVRVVDDVRASKKNQIEDTAPVEEDEPEEEIVEPDAIEEVVEE